MINKLLQFTAALLAIAFLGCFALVAAQDKSSDKIGTISGKVFRSDTKQPVPDASVKLLDEKKSDKRDNSLETKTAADGTFSFDRVVAGKYTFTIRAAFEKEADVPCHFSLGKLGADNKDPSMAAITQLLGQNVTINYEGKNGKDKLLINVTPENKRFVEQLLIKGLAVKAGENQTREFDLVCEGLPN
jgi:hypothetical protein